MRWQGWRKRWRRRGSLRVIDPALLAVRLARHLPVTSLARPRCTFAEERASVLKLDMRALGKPLTKRLTLMPRFAERPGFLFLPRWLS